MRKISEKWKDKLFIFDCDGTLVDTEPLMAKSWSTFFKKHFELDLSKKDYMKYCYGRSPQDTFDFVNKKFGLNIKRETKTREQRYAITLDLINNELKPIPGVAEFLEEIKEIRKCIASSSIKMKILRAIQKAGIDQYFDEQEIFDRDLMEKGLITKTKPAPDVYLYTAKTMGYQPNQCVVIEDSLTGIQAAQSAKMPVIGCIAPSCEDKAKARKEMEDLNVDYITDNMTTIIDFMNESKI